MEKERIVEILESFANLNHDAVPSILDDEFEEVASKLHQEFEAEKQELIEALRKTYEVLIKNIDKYSYENTTDVYVLLAENNILIEKHKGNEKHANI